MGRKLVKQGKDALTVSVPRKFINKFGLKQGDELEVTQKDNSIIYSSKNQLDVSISYLDISDLSQAVIFNFLTSLFIRGDDEIHIKFKNSSELEGVKKVLNYLVGFILVSEKKDSCVIKDMSKGVSGDLDALIKRIFIMINDYISDSINEINSSSNNNYSSFEVIQSRDGDINRIVSVSLRSLNKELGFGKDNTHIYFNLISLLEQIGDEICRLWRTASIFKLKESKNVSSATEHAKQSIDLIFKIYYRFSVKYVDDLIKTKKKARKILEDIKDSSSIENRVIRHCIQTTEKCADIVQLISILNL